MKKIIMVVLSLMFIVSCSFFLQDSSEWSGPHAKKGQADAGADFGEEEILGRRRVKQQISGYSITMPEDMEFKYGSTVYGTDKLFGKKRKYLYDNKTKTGTNIYLIEDTIENMNEDNNSWSHSKSNEKPVNKIRFDIQISLRKNTGVSDEKSLFERSEFMIFQTKGVFLRVEKFELEVLSTFWKVGSINSNVYESAEISEQIYNKFEEYKSANNTRKEEILGEVIELYKKDQALKLDLAMNGPAILDNSPFLLKTRDEYNRAELIREYNAGRYQDKGLPGIMKIGMPEEERGERKELKVSDITSYLRKLRQGVEK